MNIWMDQIEQRVMVKYLFFKEHGSKLIHKELMSTLQDNAISLSAVKNWLRRFKSGDLSCGDEERPGKPLVSSGSALHGALKKLPFASARGMAGHFSADRAALKNVLDRELGLSKFSRRWVPHMVSAEQKLRRVTKSPSLLTILADLADENFQGILPGP
jgi:hypothetical protein